MSKLMVLQLLPWQTQATSQRACDQHVVLVALGMPDRRASKMTVYMSIYLVCRNTNLAYGTSHHLSMHLNPRLCQPSG
jgi:hypothetical protein